MSALDILIMEREELQSKLEFFKLIEDEEGVKLLEALLKGMYYAIGTLLEYEDELEEEYY